MTHLSITTIRNFTNIMKNYIVFSFIFLSSFGYAQQEILVNNDWFLTKFIKDGQEIEIPQNEELQQVWAVFQYEYFKAPVVHPFYGEPFFITQTITDTTINYDTYTWEVGPCDFPENCAFESDYVYFFAEDGFPFIDYEIEQIGEFYQLTLTATPNDIAVYTNDGILANNTEIQEIAIRTYPNPVGNFLRIDLGDKNSSVYMVKITNSLGNMVLREKSNQKLMEINTQNLPAGVYFVVIEKSGNPVYRSKFLKK